MTPPIIRVGPPLMGEAQDRGLPLRPLRDRVGAAAATTLDDWGREEESLILALLRSGADVKDADQNVTVFSTAPNEKVGGLHGGTVPADLAIPGFADHSPIISESNCTQAPAN